MVTPRRIPGETDLAYLQRLAAAGERMRASIDVSDVWQLIQDADESADDYAIRALALGCGDDYRRPIQRRSLTS
jgi:hypothetical protein